MFNEDVYTCEIAGWNLVEASAGTGKTYQVQTLYARLILEKGWTVDQIVVVTFTEAATEELRERLQGILTKAATVLDGDELAPDDTDLERINALIAGAVEALATDGRDALSARELCRWRTRQACSEFDCAAIFTIHGFCARMLKECAFECGIDFDSDLVTDKARLVDEVVADVYREMVLPMTETEAEMLSSLKYSDLRKIVGSVLAKPAVVVAPDLADLNAPDDVLMEATSAFRAELIRSADAVKRWIDASGAQHCISAESALALHRHLADLVGGATDATNCEPFTKTGRSAYLQATRYLPPAVEEFGDCCEQLVNRVAGVTGKKPTLSTKWPAQLDTDADASSAIERLRQLHADHAKELNFFLDPLIAPIHFKKTAFPVDRMPQLAVALTESPTATATEIGLLSRLTHSAMRSGRFAKNNWPVAADCAPFVDVCQALVDAIKATTDRWLLRFTRQFIDRCRDCLEQTKLARNVVTYDDLLVKLRDALADENPSAALLKRAIAQRYKIAIIDEFQDTDPVQSQVFNRAFRDQDLPVFVVGDPKQAIYGFRSGDLETYFAARESTDPAKRFSLLQNWRSDGHMVASVNELFAEDSSDQSDSGRLHRSFATDKIWFPPAQAGLPDGSNTRPLTIELIDTADGKAFNKTDGATVAVELTAKRIKELLDRDANILPQHVAVLVQKHAEARLIKTALGESGIRAVLQSAGKVFDSYEAVDFKLVLAAMLDPTDLAAVRAALATPLFGITARQLYVGDDGVAAESIQQAATVFGDAHDEWVRSSFLVGFNRIVHGLGMRLHLLKAEDGERRLTNVIQIAEILERIARDQKLGMQATRRWLDRQLDKDSRVDEDAHEIRLESDDDAVTVMTVFKSKGLQFPHVFAPFMWSKQPIKSNFTTFFEYHDGVGENSKLVVDLDIKNLLQQDYDVAPERRHEDEKLGEQLRLLYVAVTRAQHSMHLVGGRLSSDQRHALHYLLSSPECPAEDEPIVSGLEKKIAPSALERSGDNLVVRPEMRARGPSALGSQTGAALAPKRTDLTAPEVMTGAVDTSWQILSFSKLADHGYQPKTLSADALRDYDDTVETENADYATREALARNPDTLFSFVGGTKTGNCWHAIFEHMDFMATDTHRDVVIEWATRFRLIRDLDKVDNDPRSQKNRQINTLCRMVRDVLTLKLPGCPVTLADVSLRHRLAEMQFDFPVPEAGVSRQIIAQCLLDSDWDRKNEFAEILHAWIAPADDDELLVMRGFMTGFIDLIFRDAVDGKYYILDWKSNSLGGTYAGFTPAGITEEMGRNRYFFQYLLYSVALHHYLSATLPSYDYNDHFGGAYYVFLRGVTPPPAFEGDWDASEHSVYYDRPSLDVINRLSTALGQFNGATHAID